MGLADPGKAAPALTEGRFDAEGPLPVNMSGGLIGQGGAPGAVGIAQAVTVDRLLRGGYHRPASKDCRIGLTDTHGGVCTSNVVHVLERVEP